MPKNPIKKTDTQAPLSPEYKSLVSELKGILDTGLRQAYKAVDNIKVQTYWQLGERIVREEMQNKERAGYGKYLIDNLSIDLGIRKRRLHEIVQFFRVYPIVRALHAQLSWYHYLELIKVENQQEREFYEQKIIHHSWAYRKLREQIKSNLYDQTTPEERQKLLQTKLPETTALEIFKPESSDYTLNFLKMNPKHKEQDIEDGIIKNIDLFLQELGEGFFFGGRQVPLKMGNKTHTVDLVLFHKGIPCTVLIDLKRGAINSQDIGQMNKYVSYWRNHCQYAYEKDAIGLVLGRNSQDPEVAYALEGLEERVFVATYKTHLPSDEDIKRAMKATKNIH